MNTEGIRISSLILVCLQLICVKFAITKTTAIVSNLTPGVSNVSGTSSRTSVGFRPQNLSIRNAFSLPDVPTPAHMETSPLFSTGTVHETMKPDTTLTRGVQGFMSSSTAPDPKYDDAYEMAGNLYMTIDSIKSLVGMLLDSGEIEVEFWKFEVRVNIQGGA